MYHESEKLDMNSDESISDDENSSKDEISSDNVKSSSDMTDNEDEVEMEQWDNDDTNPFDDFICISYKHHSQEREELIDQLLEEGNMTVEEATSEADSVLLPKLRKTLTLVFTIYILLEWLKSEILHSWKPSWKRLVSMPKMVSVSERL